MFDLCYNVIFLALSMFLPAWNNFDSLIEQPSSFEGLICSQ